MPKMDAVLTSATTHLSIPHSTGVLRLEELGLLTKQHHALNLARTTRAGRISRPGIIHQLQVELIAWVPSTVGCAQVFPENVTAFSSESPPT
jgi:hypothetical protein